MLRAVKAGGRGCVLKNSAGEELIQAIHAVQNGMAFFSPAVARTFQIRTGSRGSRTHTVETRRWRLMEKFDPHSAAGLVLRAVRRGMMT